MEAIKISNLKNPKTGKKYEVENNEKRHKYKVGNLVEIIDSNKDFESEYNGMRLYIIGLVRDCDGTPLYVLGSKGMELYQKGFGLKENVCFNFNSFPGFAENNLKLIHK